MTDLKDLYQQVIIDHGRHPRNFAVDKAADHIKEGYNPLCGDRLTVYINEENHCIEKICFHGEGCAISMASASLMTEMLQGKSIEEAKKIFENFHQLAIKGDLSQLDKLGKLAALAGIVEFPMRVKCATLAWHTLMAALVDDKKPISTE